MGTGGQKLNIFIARFPTCNRFCLYDQRKIFSLINHDISVPCSAETPLWRQPPPPVLCPSDPNFLCEGKTWMFSLLAFQRAIVRAYIGNKNGVSQTTKINYDGPAETPLWRHSPYFLSCHPDPDIFFEGKNGVLLSLSFQRAIVRVCTTRKSCYVQKHSFLASAHFPCRLDEINMDMCLKGRPMRVSPASYGSQSWVGCYQGCTGGVGKQGAENWCVDEARKRAS